MLMLSPSRRPMRLEQGSAGQVPWRPLDPGVPQEIDQDGQANACPFELFRSSRPQHEIHHFQISQQRPEVFATVARDSSFTAETTPPTSSSDK